jgi:hypothetical protein
MQHDSGTALHPLSGAVALTEQEFVLPSSRVHWQVHDVPLVAVQLTERFRELQVMLDEQLVGEIVLETPGLYWGSLMLSYRGAKAAQPFAWNRPDEVVPSENVSWYVPDDPCASSVESTIDPDVADSRVTADVPVTTTN